MPEAPVFLITGASSGIGAATARQAAGLGYRLVLAARREEKVSELSEELGGPEQALPIRCDVTDWEDQQSLIQTCLERFGRVDVVYANAGMPGSPGGFTGADPGRWRDMVLTNVYGAALTARASLEALKASKGHLLLTGSVAGRRANSGSMYSATKWAVTGMGEAIRQEMAGTGVRVTLIEPGMVDTPFFDTPKPDALRPEDVARAVLYAVDQPAHVDVNEILVRPTSQDN
ncbi:SDR family oxidoreductase [Rubrobacter aplysinae]|uniref:SDR family oxidoreductase n=1 Tax=Rubrobacter aplysinae TaxID=909625 RepID=UPI00064C38AB|nr:SDR family oxidoreductase [Rubrobacter aplysinae]